MFRRSFLLLSVTGLLLTAACSQAAIPPGNPDSLSDDSVATRVAATVEAAVPTSVAATISAAKIDPTQAMAAAMEGLSGDELATHMALMNIEPAGTPTPFFTPTPFPTFTPMPTQVEAVNIPTATPACTNLAEFIKNLTINDNTAIKGGDGFAKLWRVKNAGTCTWTTDYALVFVTGEQLGGPVSILLTQEVAPGETIDLRVNLIAPHTPGFFTGSWMLEDRNGERFGLTPDGSQPLSLTIQVKPHAMTSGHNH